MMTGFVKQGKYQAVAADMHVICQSAIHPDQPRDTLHDGLSVNGRAAVVDLEDQTWKSAAKVAENFFK
jgi:transposase